MPFDLKRFSNIKTLEELVQATGEALQGLESQLNAKPELHVNNTDTIPTGAKDTDFLATVAKDDVMRLSIPQGRRQRRTLRIQDLGGPFQLPLPDSFHILPLKTAAVVPVLADFPNPGDVGFYHKTVGAHTYFCYNDTGALRIVELL